MMKKIKLRNKVMVMLYMLTTVCILTMTNGLEVEAKSGIRLSPREKVLTEGQTITLSLKGVSAKVKTGKLKWKVSDSDVIGIKKKSHNKAVLKAWEDGEANVSVTYKGKKYRCHIKAVCRDDTITGDNSGASNDNDSGDRNEINNKDNDKPKLNATDIDLHYIEDYAIPYIGKNPDYNYEYQFKVQNYNSGSAKWSIEGDMQDKIRYRIDDTGKIYMFMGNDIAEAYTECQVVATLTDGRRLTANVRGYDDGTSYIRRKIEDFKYSRITSDMTDYEKMDRVASYLSTEYDYELYQPSWYQYIITGSGDCMASRVAVEYFCRDLGLRAAACRSIDSHGQTIVKADDKVYLVTTGFAGKKPRYYEIVEIDRETFDKINENNNIKPEYFWGGE